MVTQAPQPLSRIRNCLFPFSSPVWAAIAASFFAVATSTYTVAKLSKVREREYQLVLNSKLFFLGGRIIHEY